MTMTKNNYGRRRFLRGAGGVALGLPALDMFQPAAARPRPRRARSTPRSILQQNGADPGQRRRSRHVLAALDGADQRRRHGRGRHGPHHQRAARLRQQADLRARAELQELAQPRRRPRRRQHRRARQGQRHQAAAGRRVVRLLHRQQDVAGKGAADPVRRAARTPSATTRSRSRPAAPCASATTTPGTSTSACPAWPAWRRPTPAAGRRSPPAACRSTTSCAPTCATCWAAPTSARPTASGWTCTSPACATWK